MQASFAAEREPGAGASDGGPPRPSPAAHLEQPAAVDVVLQAPRRVRPIPRWRLRLVAFATQLTLLLAVGGG